MFKRLVFCGGGTRCLVFLQSLLELEKANYLHNVHEYWGTSAGALVASMMALTKSTSKTKDILFSTEFMRFRDVDISNLLGIQSSWGLDDGTSLVRELERIFELVEPGSKSKRMIDISGLHIVCADMTIHETIVCNSKTFPTMRVVDAVRASMSLPIMFRPYIHPESGHLWVDGAVRENFPWNVLPSDTERAESLGFAFEKSWLGGPKTFSEYMFSMLHFDEPKKMRKQKQEWPNNILWYKPPPFPPWFIRLQTEDFELMDSIGSKVAKDWITSHALSKTSEIPPRSYRPNALPHLPTVCTNGLSGTQTHLSEPFQDSRLHQFPSISRSSRRWSV